MNHVIDADLACLQDEEGMRLNAAGQQVEITGQNNDHRMGYPPYAVTLVYTAGHIGSQI